MKEMNERIENVVDELKTVSLRLNEKSLLIKDELKDLLEQVEEIKASSTS